MAFLDELFSQAQASYPTRSTGNRAMAERNFDYFNQPEQAANPNTAFIDKLIQSGKLPPLPAIQQSQMMPGNAAPAAAVPQQEASGVADPYNMLERIFLTLGGEGEAVKKDKNRYAISKAIESMPAPPGNDQRLNALRAAAIKNPELFGETYLKATSPDYKTQEVDGQIVRWDSNDPNAKPNVIFGGGEPGAGPNRKQVAAELDLRKQFDSLTAPYREVRDAYKRVEASAKNPSAAGDLALIFNYMKILDPGSTVREGEFATAQNAGSVPSQILAQYNKVVSGERLTDGMRGDFTSRAKSLFEAQADSYNKTAEQYRGYAKDYGYNPDRIAQLAKISKTLPPPLPANASREQKLQRLQELKALKGGR